MPKLKTVFYQLSGSVSLKTVIQKFKYWYLLSVPPVATILAFAVGHVDSKVYIPIWLLNALIMIWAVKGRHQIIWYFVIPWLLIAIFGGMGPPPETPAAWAALALEQQIRYTILITSGILMAIGFWRVNESLAGTSGRRYAKYSKVLFLVALPLFVMNMAYWGFYLTQVFVSGHRPEWHKTLGVIATGVRMTEVALIYLATAALARALLLAERLSNTSALIYIGFSFMLAVLNFLPSSASGLLAILNYLSYIPAFTLLIPYLIAVNLFLKMERES